MGFVITNQIEPQKMTEDGFEKKTLGKLAWKSRGMDSCVCVLDIFSG